MRADGIAGIYREPLVKWVARRIVCTHCGFNLASDDAIPCEFWFWVFQRNTAARRFYEQHDCRLIKLTDGRGNEEREPDALYEKLLKLDH